MLEVREKMPIRAASPYPLQRQIKMINPIFYIDFYKVGHVIQYPSDTTQVFSNWTPRSSRVAGQTDVVCLGFTYFAKDYLDRRFNQGFFKHPWPEIEAEYRAVITATLGVAEPKIDHIKALHEPSKQRQKRKAKRDAKKG